MSTNRDHIFISYAWEDAALAEWLGRKLMATGYAVWLDRFKLLGGDVWPDDIDDAIKNRSYRMVHLLSRHSLAKENPSKERQMALTLGKNRKEKFLITLNVDGLTPQELPWQLSDIQYIPFMDWASGLRELLKTLDAHQCPRPWEENGQSLAVRSYFPVKAVKEQPETLYSNCYSVSGVPAAVKRFSCNKPFTSDAAERTGRSKWPCYRIDDRCVLAFDVPPDDLGKEYGFRNQGVVSWTSFSDIDGVYSRNVVKSLIRQSLSCVAAKRGLVYHESGKYWYFSPEALDENGGIHFCCYTGKRTYIKACGERKAFHETLKYFLAFKVLVRDDILDSFSFQVRIRLHLRDSNNADLDPSKVLSRRKAIVGNWWNHEWYLRQEAIVSFLSEEQDAFSWGGTDKTSVVFSAAPFSADIPFSLDDEYIDSLRTAGKTEEEIKQAAIEEQVAETPD